jgi:hypothetical protein
MLRGALPRKCGCGSAVSVCTSALSVAVQNRRPCVHRHVLGRALRPSRVTSNATQRWMDRPPSACASFHCSQAGGIQNRCCWPPAAACTNPKPPEANSQAMVGGEQAAARALTELDGIASPRPDPVRPGRAAPGPRPQTGGAAGHRSPPRQRPVPLRPIDANAGAWPAAPAPAPAKAYEGGSGARGDARPGLHAYGAAATQEQRHPGEASSGEEAAAVGPGDDQTRVPSEHSAHAPRLRPARRTAERRTLDFGVQASSQARTRACPSCASCHPGLQHGSRAATRRSRLMWWLLERNRRALWHLHMRCATETAHAPVCLYRSRAGYPLLTCSCKETERNYACWLWQVYARSPPPPPLPQCASPHGKAPPTEQARPPRRQLSQRPATRQCDNACS